MSDESIRPIVGYWVYVNDKAWVRVYINDVPLYRTPTVGPDSRSGPLNYLLRRGENELKVEVLKTGAPQEGAHQDNAFIFQLYTVSNLDAPETEKLERTILLDTRYPGVMSGAETQHQRLPFYHREVFRIDEDLATPLLFNAPAGSFECDGTPELRGAVQRIHDLLAAEEYEAFMDELSLKFACDEAAHEGDPDRREGVRKAQWREELLAYEPRPNGPLDMSQIHFEPRRDGQVAYVTRHDEQYVLDAVCAKDPARRIRTDLLMVRHQGRWRVFA